MKWLASGTSFIIQAILVVASVLVFAYFDPFNIFVSNKLTLKDTPVHVKKIREIGELTTAEFYGEVISSYQTLVEINRNEEIDRMHQQIREMDSSFKVRVYALLSIEKQAEQRKQFNLILDEFAQNSYFDIYKDRLGKKVNTNFFNPLFRRLVIESRIESLGDETDYLKDVYSESEKQISANYNKAKIKKPQLILLGRGKVSAGFRFDKMDLHNIRIDTTRNRIILVGLTPEILNCDINPWLIPELGIKGFEIVEVNRRADDPAILQRVKQACYDSLLAQAIASDILTIAKTNAEQNLKQFFSIILNNPDIEVKIVASDLDYYLKYVVCDTLVDPSQLIAIEQLVNADASLITEDSVKIAELMDSLSVCKLRIGMNRYPITPFSLPVFRYLRMNLVKMTPDTNQLNQAVNAVLSSIRRSKGNFDKYLSLAYQRRNITPLSDTLQLVQSLFKVMSTDYLNKPKETSP
jgi:hypothetical protein